MISEIDKQHKEYIKDLEEKDLKAEEKEKHRLELEKLQTENIQNIKDNAAQIEKRLTAETVKYATKM